MQPAKVTPQQYADDLVASSCKVVDVHDEWSGYDLFIEGVDQSICNTLSQYWAQNLQVDLADIVFKAELLRSIQKSAKITSTTNQSNFNQRNLQNRKPQNIHSSAIIGKPNTTSTPVRSFRHRSESLPVLAVHTPDRKTSVTESTQRSLSSMLSYRPSFCIVCNGQGYLTPMFLLLAQDSYHSWFSIFLETGTSWPGKDAKQYPERQK